MAEPIVAIDVSGVREGRLEDVRSAIRELAAFVDANEPTPILYNAYLDGSSNQLTVIQVHPDSASLEQHMTIAGPAFPKFAELIRMRSMDVYGEPSQSLLRLLRQKAEMLGGIPVTVHTRHAGFDRFDT